MNEIKPIEPDIDDELEAELVASRAFRRRIQHDWYEPPNPWVLVGSATVAGWFIGGIYTVILFHLY